MKKTKSGNSMISDKFMVGNSIITDPLRMHLTHTLRHISRRVCRLKQTVLCLVLTE